MTAPRATYRLQLHRDFALRDAAAIVPYLARLGISHLYLSPILKARAGSQHGYDVVDHSAINPELGSEEDFAALAHTAREHGLGILLDIVPNHMGVLSADNPWWLDVLENGRASRYAEHFDIDWEPQRAEMRNRLLIPVLGEAYGRVLESGEMQVSFDADTGSFALHYYEHGFPLDPRTYPLMFDTDAAGEREDEQDFASLMDAFASLPATDEPDDTARTRRYRDKEATKRRLARLCERSAPVRTRVEAAVAAINGAAINGAAINGAAINGAAINGEAINGGAINDGATNDAAARPASFDRLHALLEAQPYRLASWRVAGAEINYRRFFDINTLAALRVERPEVFADTHDTIFDWIARGFVQGLRIDHPDGLYDPREYFERLQRRHGGNEAPLYVVVEKILASYEKLREDWAVAGTTGYEFGALATAWLTDPAGEVDIDAAYAFFLDERPQYEEIAHASRRFMMSTSLAAEITVLAAQLDRIAQGDRHTRDFTASSLRDAIVEVIACFPVYRTYVSRAGLIEEDRALIERAIETARARSRVAQTRVFDFLLSVLTLELADRASERGREALTFCAKFQQVTSPVAAKGVEDTAFYRYVRLVSGNEVGSEPRRFAASTHALHESASHRASRWPSTLLATSTHDTKRCEDVRARVSVLSEMPQRWRAHLRRWLRLNRAKRQSLIDGDAPSRNDEYLFYQTLLGIWPATPIVDTTTRAALEERVADYMLKAAREAKLRTSWQNPNAEYEAAMRRFIALACDDRRSNAFLEDFRNLLQPVAYFGAFNGIAQTVLKLTSPGVPDLYQGTELPTYTLVDPDNRGPVDYARREQCLARLLDERERATHRRAWLRDLFESPRDERAKLLVIASLLDLRRQDPALFHESAYEPLAVTGTHADHLCAFARTLPDRTLIVIVPRWCARLMGQAMEPPLGDCWQDTRVELPELPGALQDWMTGNAVMAKTATTTATAATAATTTAKPTTTSFSIADLLGATPFAVLLSRA